MPIYLKFSGISGTTTNPKFIGASSLISYSHDLNKNALTFSKKFDKATHALWDAISSGEKITSARAWHVDQKGKVVMKTTFSDLLIMSYQDSGDEKDRVEYFSADYEGFDREWPQ